MKDRASEGFDEGLYCCTSCGKCVEVCPKEINTFGAAIEKLREIACKEDVGPLPVHRDVKELIKSTGRSVQPMGKGPYGEGFIKAVYDQKIAIKSPSEDETTTSPESIKDRRLPCLLVAWLIIDYQKLE